LVWDDSGMEFRGGRVDHRGLGLEGTGEVGTFDISAECEILIVYHQMRNLQKDIPVLPPYTL